MHAQRRIHHNMGFCKMLVFPIYFATNLLIMVCPNRSLGKTGQNGSEKVCSFVVSYNNELAGSLTPAPKSTETQEILGVP